jgi:RNA polymerase sigma-70 factor (ECF subfamily)
VSGTSGEASEDPRERTGRLVRAARRGDLGAFDELIRRFQRQATAVAYRLLNHREDALEVVQDAFLRAFEKLETLSQPEQFRPWLMRIVTNLALNRRRSRALRTTVPLDAAGRDGDDAHARRALPDPRTASPVQVASGEELRDKIAEAIEQLPPMQRQALVLFSLAGLPQKDVAEQLGCSVQAVKWHVFAARKTLKEKFRDYL